MKKIPSLLFASACMLLALACLPLFGQDPGNSKRAFVVRRMTDAQSHVQARIELFRDKLPEEYHGRRNFAWAVALVDGVDKWEYFAHSGINELDQVSDEAAALMSNISIRPVSNVFTTLCVNGRNQIDAPDCWDRSNDTEFKIIEDLTARLGDRTDAAGRVRLYTDLPPCASCANVMTQFLNRYTNIQLEVWFRY